MGFSVIIPLYNKADTVERAIRSVLGQPRQDFEIIVVDDGSKDDGAEKVERIRDPRIRLIRQENGGVAAARNTGIANAKYDFVTFLDADDEYLPHFLETLSRMIEKYPATSIWGTGYTFQMPDGRKVDPRINGIPADFEGYLPNYFEIASKSAPPLWTGAVCVRKTALLQFGGFPVGIRSGEDLLTWARLCANGIPAYTMRRCSLYYLSVQQSTDRKPVRIPQVPDAVGPGLAQLYHAKPSRGLRKYCALWHKMRASGFSRSGYRFAGLKETLIGLYWDPRSLKLYFYLLATLLPTALWGYVFEHFKKR